MSKLVVLGSVNLDHLMQVSHFPRPGETLPIGQYQTVAGGKGANQAVAAARLGADTALIACVGEDGPGRQMTQAFADDGMDVRGVKAMSGHSTGMAMIYVDSKGENNIGIWPGANQALTQDQLPQHQAVIGQAEMLLMQLETPLETIERAAKLARAAGTQVVLNPAPAQPLSVELLGCVDMITPNETEAELLTGIALNNLEDTERAAQALHGFGIKTVLITLGKNGVWVSEQGQGQHVPGFVVEARDTTAAGDTFNGALVTRLLEGSSLSEALPFAQAAAAISVTRMGAQSSIPTRDEVDAFVSEQ